MIKVTCNGPDEHINEVLYSVASKELPVTRGFGFLSSGSRERIILPCEYCEGRVIVSLDMFGNSGPLTDSFKSDSK